MHFGNDVSALIYRANANSGLSSVSRSSSTALHTRRVMFVVIFFYLATVLNRKAAFIKQRSKTQLFEILFSKDFVLSMIHSLSVYCDNSYVKLSQKYKVFLFFNGYTAS